MLKLVYLHILLYNEMTKRTSKEYFINKKSLIKTKYGTLNKNNPEVLYIRSKAKLRALEENKDYKDELTNISFVFQKYVKQLIKESKLFNKHICTFETPEKGIVFNKKSYVKFDVYLKPNIVQDMGIYENYFNNLTYQLDEKLIQLCAERQIAIE